MKIITLLLAGSLLVSGELYSQQPGNEQEVRVVLQQMGEAWEARDYAYTKNDLLDDNCVLINPVGMYWKNKAEITRGLQYLGEIRFKYHTVIKDSVLSIRFLSPTTALVVVNVIDQVTEDYSMPGGVPGGKKGEKSEGLESFTLIKKNGRWKISSLHITHVDPDVSVFNKGNR